MGADLIVAPVAWRDGQTFDVEAGYRAIDEADLETLDPIGQFDMGLEDDEVAELRGRRKAQLDEVIEAANQERHPRDVTDIKVSGWTIMLAGGSTWGGSPGDTFDAVTGLDEIILKAAGFSWPGEPAS